MVLAAKASVEESIIESQLPPSGDPPAVEVRTVYRDVVIGTRFLHNQRGGRDFVIGSDRGADAPVAPDFIPATSHPLVAAVTGGGYVVNVTPRMTGEIRVGDRVTTIGRAWGEGRGGSFSLPANGRARLVCGSTTFLVTATSPPRRLRVPWLTWRWDQQVYSLGSAGAIGIFLLLILAIPPDPRSLSLDLLSADGHFVKFLVKPPQDERPEEPAEKDRSDQTRAEGAASQRHKGDEGQMGNQRSRNQRGATGMKGPKDNPDPHLAKTLAENRAKTAGILGVLARLEGSHVASIFGHESALGTDAEEALGQLLGDQLADAWGRGGLGLVGTGDHGGGTGERLLGVGKLDVIGKGSGHEGPGSGHDRGIGVLTRRHAITPDPVQGILSVRGSLDKEIVRRTIRRHINEVKYCYELGLAQRSGLGGRVVVQFTIAGAGQVIAAVLQSSTLGNAKVENCAVQAVRRWEFPAPLGGGLVIVSYPFVLTPAGGAD